MRKYLYAILSLAVLPLAGCFGPVTAGLQAVIVTDPSPAHGPYPLTATFDASRSRGDIVEYLWSFGDDTTGSEPSLSHTYHQRGTYVVYLTVVGRDGSTDQTSTTVYVHSQRPVARFTVFPSTAKVGYQLTFNAADSYDPDGEIAEYRWDFNDGTTEFTTVPEVAHTYSAPGDYLVTLVVVDATGDMSYPAHLSVRIEPRGCCG
ncbi:PKD domain-containing protein [Candidatus Bipolaricaulota bacterium]|nr:PKD domain-containing protein [Candidatus Bipolaricaulota bacterium]